MIHHWKARSVRGPLQTKLTVWFNNFCSVKHQLNMPISLMWTWLFQIIMYAVSFLIWCPGIRDLGLPQMLRVVFSWDWGDNPTGRLSELVLSVNTFWILIFCQTNGFGYQTHPTYFIWELFRTWKLYFSFSLIVSKDFVYVAFLLFCL